MLNVLVVESIVYALRSIIHNPYSNFSLVCCLPSNISCHCFNFNCLSSVNGRAPIGMQNFMVQIIKGLITFN
jgi:hypothetical protein